MNAETLLGKQVAIEVSDPWELTAEPGEPARRAIVADKWVGGPHGENEAILLELLTPIEYGGREYVAVVATARQSESLIASLVAANSVEASLLGISRESPPEDPLSAGWWHGGLAMNAVLTLHSPFE